MFAGTVSFAHEQNSARNHTLTFICFKWCKLMTLDIFQYGSHSLFIQAIQVSAKTLHIEMCLHQPPLFPITLLLCIFLSIDLYIHIFFHIITLTATTTTITSATSSSQGASVAHTGVSLATSPRPSPDWGVCGPYWCLQWGSTMLEKAS